LTTIAKSIEGVLKAQESTRRPLAIVLAGHNGSGKSTMWRRLLSDRLQMPLVNADRMMLSILPEPGDDGHLAPWAVELRDSNRSWMGVAQQGVLAFVGHAMGAKVPFAMETVFSHWDPKPGGGFASKIDLILDMQNAGYFVLLLFVGLTNADLSVLRVTTRVSEGGHGVDEATLRKRFPKTQRAISEALKVADASILVDNSRTPSEAFTVCSVRVGDELLYDSRSSGNPAPLIFWRGWMR
jgi:predicted ABC-type ATPase